MKHSILIISEETRARAIEIIRNLPLEPVHEVNIKVHKKDLSAEQRALYWVWLTTIGNELGESKDCLHLRYKDAFLVSIYERDKPEYAEMMQSLRDVWRKGAKGEAISLRGKIVALTSIMDADTKQMAEYMTEIERHAAGMAIRLPVLEK